MKSRLPFVLLALLVVAMAALMWRPMWEETATVDETTFMGGGYAYFKTGSCKMAEENPLLGCMIMAAPMLAFDVHLSDQAIAVMESRAFSPVAWPWFGTPRRFQDLFPQGANWYHYGLSEAQYFGQAAAYDPRNDADRLMFWSRFTQMLLTLATGGFLFFWARQLTGNAWAGLMAAALWTLNPVVLAYGHLSIAEPGVTLMFPIAMWWFVRTLEAPSLRNMFLLGVIVAVAMEMKFLALMLGPMFVVLLTVWWLRHRTVPAIKQTAQRAGMVALGFWVALLVIFFPHWSPPPPIDPAQADALGVPGWFQMLRPLLIPGDFFKAVTLKVLHSRAGHNAYLLGEWSDKGWWYYFPVVIFFKTPIPMLLLIAVGLMLVLRQFKSATLASLAPWIGAAVYLLVSMPNKVDIGVRHMMPVYPLLVVGIADQLNRAGQRWQIAGWVLCGWLTVIAALSHPYYISYCNELAGGMENGYKALIDSNYDWGQDGKRLKWWMEQNGVSHVYLDYFGTQASIEWHRIPNTRVNADQARQLRNGVLVVSASQLMRPEWAWLRESRQPTTRIAYTLFVYRLS